MTALNFLVDRKDLTRTRWQETAAPDPNNLAAGATLLRIDRFALTANNITYAVAGDRMSYWEFFPAEPPWGQVPVWGFADVVASKHPAVAVGERFYGYYPMATHLIVQPQRARASGFDDGASHRAALPAVYNQYRKTGADIDPDTQAQEMLYRPLFMTSFIIDDYLAEAEFFGAEAVLLTSASSKTSLGLAFALQRRGGPAVVGLTSAANAAFVRGLGCYDEVVVYQEIERLDPQRTAVLVDMAGNGTTLASVHRHFDGALKQSILVGATHWDARGGAKNMPGPTPELFFAPTHIARRIEQWGAAGLDERFTASWVAFIRSVSAWIDVQDTAGTEAVEAAYRSQLAGHTPPSIGYICRL